MSSGEHDQLELSPEEANDLSAAFWRVYLESRYPDGYVRAIIREQYDGFRADFVAASKSLIESTERYLGAEPGSARLCPCPNASEKEGKSREPAAERAVPGPGGHSGCRADA